MADDSPHSDAPDSTRTPGLAITVGDPNGIGPDLIFALVENFHAESSVNLHIVSPPSVLADRLKLYRRYCDCKISISSDAISLGTDRVPLIAPADLPESESFELSPGTPTDLSGRIAAESILTAVELVRDGRTDGLVTMPIAKSALRDAGYPWPGHTEMLGAAFGVSDPLMILATKGMRVALATIHVALEEVTRMITPTLLSERTYQFARSLQQDFGIEEPRIAILALDPHAGDSGAIGSTDSDVIAPTIERLRADGLLAHGPYPSDGFFARYDEMREQFDGILAMYHDQGLIPLKMFAAGHGVNITAGLPIVRTSPDHGTAFDIAGRERPDPTSSVEAVRVAREIVLNRRTFSHG